MTVNKILNVNLDDNDYEVKVIPDFDLDEEQKKFIFEKIEQLCNECDMEVHEDKITYSKKRPYKKFEDIPAGFRFYNKMIKYKNYLTALEYYSYLERDINGRII
ncbi:MAG: hypothetical protein R3Y47_01110 [Lachnospiraceae bacterium]